MKTSLLLLLSFGGRILTTCQAQSTPDYSRLTIHAAHTKDQSIKLSTPNVFTLEPITLIEAKLDANGTASLTLPLTKNQFADLTIDGKNYGLLLSPGNDLLVNVTDQSASPPASFSGKGAEAATYLLELAAIWRQYERRGGNHLLQLPPQAFASRLDSVQKAYADFNQRFTTRSTLDKALLHLLAQKSRMQLLTYKLNYAMAQYNPGDATSQALPALERVVREVPFDPSLLPANVYEYGFVLSMYLQAGLYAPLVAGKSSADRAIMQQQLASAADQQINRMAYPPTIRTFLRAKNVYESLRQGITPITDSLVASLQKEPGYVAYEPAISASYAKWQALLPGRIAPDFTGITPTGNVLSLRNLRGKVVYVDVWATWCVPCREEFPQAKELQKHFATNDQVIFLYVSIDRDLAAWQKLLANDAEFKGLHINQPPGEHFDSLWKAYQLSSIPRYMLIDQAGKLVDVNAARPSSGTIGKQIERLLH